MDLALPPCSEAELTPPLPSPALSLLTPPIYIAKNPPLEPGTRLLPHAYPLSAFLLLSALGSFSIAHL